MKTLVQNYTFDAASKQITFTDYTAIVLERVLLVTDVTNNTIIYRFETTGMGGSVSTNVLTLDYDTTSGFSDADPLQIYYEREDNLVIEISSTVSNNNQSFVLDSEDYSWVSITLNNPDGKEFYWGESDISAIAAEVGDGGLGAGQLLLWGSGPNNVAGDGRFSFGEWPQGDSQDEWTLQGPIGCNFFAYAWDETDSDGQITGTISFSRRENVIPGYTLDINNQGGLATIAFDAFNRGSNAFTTYDVNSDGIKSDLDTIATNTTNIPNTIGTPGSATPSKTVVISGSDGTDVRTIKTDTSGNVDVNIQGTVPVSGTFWQATQPVSGTVTANAGTNLNTSLLALESGGNLATIAGTVSGGKVEVDGSGVTQPVSASALPLPTGASTSALQITGNTSLATIATALGSTLSVSASSFGGITNQSSGSITVADSGSTTITGQNGQSIVTGTATTGSFISKSISDQTVTINISGTFSATVVVEVDVDTSTPTWVQRGIHQSGTSYVTSTFTSPAIGHMNISGMDAVRVRCTNYVSGSISVTITQGAGLSSTYIANPIQLADGTTPSQHLAINASGQITEANSTGIKSDLDTLAGTVSSSKINVNISSGGSTNYALETGGNLATVAGAVSGGKFLVTETSAAGIKTDLDTISGAISGGKMLIARTDTAPATGGISAQDTVSTTATGMNSQSIITGTPTANSFASFALTAQETVGVQITGSWTGTLQSEISFDGGTIWYIRGLHQPGTTFTTSAFTENASGICNVSAVTNYRIRATATWTGSATIRIVETGNDAVTYIANAVTLNTGAALIGQVSASNETSTVFNGATALTPLFATIVASSSGATSLVSSVSSKRIRVLAAYLTASGAVNVKFQSHVTPTDLTGLAYLTTNTGFVLPYNPLGWFQTVSGEQLDINLSGSVAVGGTIVYVTV